MIVDIVLNNHLQNHESFINALLCFSYQIPPMLTHHIASHLVEKVLLVAPAKQHGKLFEKFFKGHLITLVLHPVSNYLVQHLMTSTTDTTLVSIVGHTLILTNSQTVQMDLVWVYYLYGMELLLHSSFRGRVGKGIWR